MKTWVMKDTQIQVSDKGLVEIQNEHLKKIRTFTKTLGLPSNFDFTLYLHTERP